MTEKRLSSSVSTKKSHEKCSVKDDKLDGGGIVRETRDEAGPHLSISMSG